jgi:hypothetical protein
MTDADGTNRKEAPCNGDVVKPSIVTSNVGTPSVNLRPRCHRPKINKQFIIDSKGRNYLYLFSSLDTNCMLSLSSRTWNELYVCIFIKKLWEGWTPPTRSHPEFGKG